ncbi:MAG: phenylalanine--tRNA ligase subunit beta [Finegoldia magna]|uniref:phenylalanine--tRNA ligase subunit beta n=1 Tax=Finegoldia magna TaxID=1260 RepID=UPI00291174AB|nr:phenylalanine--tRNA ligase subunit beta [Finegoldia magna]MDU5960663.1 phenylalanine--tRNA ligase subunit beta [Finegoldia magna]
MLLPINWLKDYVDVDESIKTITDRLSETGSHVESVIDKSKYLNDKLIVAQIKKIDKHPNADRLSIVTLDTGNSEIEVVTGAKNIKEDMFVCYAQVGATLPGGIVLKEADLKGIMSPGMLTSFEEMGFETSVVDKNSKDGIAVLSENKIGETVTEALEINEPIIEFEITPNRPDCLSVLGMAREYAASFRKKIKYPSIEIKNFDENINDYVNSVDIQTNKCTRYVARVVKNVKIGDSPQWLKNRLIQSGIRPINNIVDITNFVMLETGQPIHAYDLDKIADKKIIVKESSSQKFTTLDDVERELSDDIIICDGENTLGIAGIMGGFDSEITSDTTNVLIEAASFDSDTIRLSSRRLSLRTDASTRFEKGVSQQLCDLASLRVCKLIEDITNATVINNSIDVITCEEKLEDVELSYKKCNDLLGSDISIEEIKNILQLLEFKIVSEDDEKIKVKVPFHRQDVSIYQDLIEEVGRIYTFEKIGAKPLIGKLKRCVKSEERIAIDNTKKALYSMNTFEVLSYSFISPKSYSKAMVEMDDDKLIKLINPLGEDFSVMRSTIIPNILDILSKNYKNKIKDICVYELGNTFHLVGNERIETKKLALGMYGDYDFYDVRSMILALFNELGIDNYEIVKNKDNKTYLSGRCADILVNGELIATFGEISYEVRDNYDFDNRVYIGEIHFTELIKHMDFKKLYSPISKYPSIERDIALVVDRELESIEIEKEILNHSNGIIKDVYLFDEYKGEHVDNDKKSLAYRIIYQSKDETLKDKTIEKIQEEILNSLEQKFNATLRK